MSILLTLASEKSINLSLVRIVLIADPTCPICVDVPTPTNEALLLMSASIVEATLGVDGSESAADV